MVARDIPVVQARNIWCAKCGRCQFEVLVTNKLRCIYCNSTMEWDSYVKAWRPDPSPVLAYWWLHPRGTRVVQQGYGGYYMEDVFDPNTGRDESGNTAKELREGVKQ